MSYHNFPFKSRSSNRNPIVIPGMDQQAKWNTHSGTAKTTSEGVYQKSKNQIRHSSQHLKFAGQKSVSKRLNQSHRSRPQVCLPSTQHTFPTNGHKKTARLEPNPARKYHHIYRNLHASFTAHNTHTITFPNCQPTHELQIMARSTTIVHKIPDHAQSSKNLQLPIQFQPRARNPIAPTHLHSPRTR